MGYFKTGNILRYVCPLIVVEDIERSRQFYENILDRKVKYNFGENVTFHGDFAIHLKSHFSELIKRKPVVLGGNNFELYFEYDNIDLLAENLRESGVEFIHEPVEQPWRQKVIRFYDPDRNIIEIGESLEFLSCRLSKEGKSLDEIASITNMPADFVRSSIGRYSDPTIPGDGLC